MNPSEYQRYLASREWALKRETVKKRCKGKCERCHFGKYSQTHHLTYEHVGDERLEELQALCEPCHKFLSAKSDIDPAEERRVREYLRAYATHAVGSRESTEALGKLSQTSLAPLTEDLVLATYIMGLYPEFYLNKLKGIGRFDIVVLIESANRAT